MTNPTCTVLFSTGPCGRPAVTSFTTAEGKTYWECADHDASPRLLGRPGTTAPVGTVLRTRSQAPYALVADSPMGPTIRGLRPQQQPGRGQSGPPPGGQGAAHRGGPGGGAQLTNPTPSCQTRSPPHRGLFSLPRLQASLCSGFPLRPPPAPLCPPCPENAPHHPIWPLKAAHRTLPMPGDIHAPLPASPPTLSDVLGTHSSPH
jgi:hypothetical protein